MGDDWLMGDNIVGDDLIWDDTGKDDDDKKADKPAVSMSGSDESQSSNQHSGMPTIHNADIPNINTAGEMSSSPVVDTSIPPDDMFAFLDDVHTDDSEGARAEASHHAGTSAHEADMGDDMIDNLTAGFDTGAGNLDAEDTDIDLPDDVLAAYGVLDEDTPSTIEDNVPPVIAQSEEQADANTVVPQDMRNAMPEEVLADDIQEVLPDIPHDGQHSVQPALRNVSMPEGNPPEHGSDGDLDFLDDYLDTLGIEPETQYPDAISSQPEQQSDSNNATDTDRLPEVDTPEWADGIEDIHVDANTNTDTDVNADSPTGSMSYIHNAGIVQGPTDDIPQQSETNADGSGAFDDSPWGDFNTWNLPEQQENPDIRQASDQNSDGASTSTGWWDEQPETMGRHDNNPSTQPSIMPAIQNASIANSPMDDNQSDGSDPWSGFYDSGGDEESDDDPFAIPANMQQASWSDDDQGSRPPVNADGGSSWFQDDNTNGDTTAMPNIRNASMPTLQNVGIMNDDTDTDDEEDDDANHRSILKIIIIVVAALLGIAVISGGAWVGYNVYTSSQQEQARQVEEQKRQDTLNKAKTTYQDAAVAANKLIEQVGESPVAEDKTLEDLLNAVNTLLDDVPSGKKPKMYESAADDLNEAVDKLNAAYSDAMDALLESRTKTLSDLINIANGLGDAPDGDDKKQMQELASKWKERLDDLTVDDLSDIDEAVSSLQSLTGKVQQAKADEEKRKAEEEAQQQAEQQAQQQQSYTPSYTPAPNYTPTTPQPETSTQQPDTTTQQPQQPSGNVGSVL